MPKGSKGDKTSATSPYVGQRPAGPEAPATDLSGRTLGDFRILRRLGQGGMGQVYLAEQLSLKRKVALKILRADLAADPTARKRFAVEAQAVARASHANIVQVYDTDNADGFYFIALEYVEGRNLRDFMVKKGPPDILVALSIMRQVAAALQRAGELGIIHRDIKPENILLTRRGEVKVADFGLSRVLDSGGATLNLTQSGVTMGTPLYMAPEQVEGKALDHRTDIYAFGVTCYHMLAGQPPFRGQTAFEVALQHVRAAPEALAVIRPDLPADLCAIVHKMMAKDPAERYQTCRDLLRDLARVREGLNGPQTMPVTTLPADASSPAGTEAVSLPAISVPEQSALLGPTTSGRATARGKKARQRTRRFWLILASLALALVAGAGLGGLRLWFLAHKTPAPAPGGPEPVEFVVPFSDAEREKFLLSAVEQYANPGDDQDRTERIRFGMGHSVELTLFYLDRYRLEDADRLFARLDNPEQKVRPYRLLGRLGHAMVLALKDDADESNKIFQQLFKEVKDMKGPVAIGPRERFVQTFGLNQYPKLHIWVWRALDHNVANATPEKPFPKELEVLRLPPAVPRKPAGRGA